MSKDNNNNIVSVGKVELTPEKLKPNFDPEALPLMTTRDLVLFPGVTVPVTLARESSRAVAEAADEGEFNIGVICQKNPENESPGLDDLFDIGVLAKVLQVFDLPDGNKVGIIHALGKIRIEGEPEGEHRFLTARVSPVRETMPRREDPEFEALVNGIRSTTLRLIENDHGPMGNDMAINLKNDPSGTSIVNTVCTNAPFSTAEKIEMLRKNRVKDRAYAVMAALSRDEEKMRIYSEVMERTKAQIDDSQRKNILRAQMDTLKDELYGEDDDVAALRERADALNLPEAIKTTFDKELVKLERTPQQSPDYSLQYAYLDTLLELPWGKEDSVNTDFSKAEATLDSEHFGLEKVKERILEQLAVVMNAPGVRAPILCLVGAPGVGKTSLGSSIAAAMGRKYERVALGGLHDEAEIRGHRRTYIGAMPGRIISALKRAGSCNPVILLDEIDKVGSDFRGDPSAALLEVLDPEQNVRFHDNYIDVDFDLSKVLFIATANTLQGVAQPLLDRMEIIEISGYLLEEKVEIAKRHLLPRLHKQLGLADGEVKVSDDAIVAVIESYTGESGVRQLEKRLAALLRKAVLNKMRTGAVAAEITPDRLGDYLGVAPYQKERYEGNDFPGVVTGLAWTQAGGAILYVESSLAPGKGDKLALTGNLGDVMKESAVIALQYVKAHAAELGIPMERIDNHSLHIHVPEGAIPKDGPSAGITMATSIASALTGRKVRERLAMTGEITLRGKVLPVGGIKEKILAAKRAGIDTIILSSANRKDVGDIKEVYRRGLTFHYVDTVSQVLDFALLPAETN
ncbi:MAG: endopeptidase La [Candidatus Amulumruptor caecigallinarius]|nr:endopeptidase La [Candidatus Amulumruptor caecigallinarius]MCM1396835.1 endopeptidase La [Candidatus Amulumruptor caecigallinarius]MCM1454221.1 endopeptidase La [bacterium]